MKKAINFSLDLVKIRRICVILLNSLQQNTIKYLEPQTIDFFGLYLNNKITLICCLSA